VLKLRDICTGLATVAFSASFIAASHTGGATSAPQHASTHRVKSILTSFVTPKHSSARSADYRYPVKTGDTLSEIAKTQMGTDDWAGLYLANRHVIGKNYNVIEPGQTLTLKLRSGKLPSLAIRHVVTHTSVSASYVPTHHSVSTSSVSHTSSVSADAHYSGSSSMQQCIISRESGGNPNVMNSSGHYGLYQFSESTWVAYGGSAADFGNASVSEQNQVFATAVSRNGYNDWTPYDGC
jgi:LysM repeat protein